jgi:tRNA pseudouridine38-40 synthase
MRIIRMTVAYDGTEFAGFQAQVGQRTVQGTLEDALGHVVQESVRIAGAGRTDAGVHATGQVVSFSTASALPTETLRRAVNAWLPEDVVVPAVAEALAGFHARFSARGRGYRYTIWNAPERLTVGRRYAFHWRSRLDDGAMDSAAQLLQGRHDFAAFGGSTAGAEHETSTVRTLIRLHCWRDGDRLLIDAAADGFLPHMVRNLVGTLVHVGMGQWTGEQVAEILASRDRRRAGVTAPALGLCLTNVWYA